MTIVNDGWIKTTCAYCGVGCGVEARAKSCGELEIRGDKSHPSNYGKLCTKGIALGDTVIHDGRLLAPIDKTFEKNSNTCVEYMTPPDRNIDWDEATSIVASKFSETIERYGPDSVAFYVSGQLLTEDYYVANKLIKGFIGSSNIDSNSRLCMASSVVGHKRAFGADTVPVCYQDLDEADLVILVGSNLAWCHPVLFQRLRLAQQKNSKLQIVVIDPRQTDTCSIADEHLAIKSGADVALFNGLLNYLVTEDCVDKAFINEHTNGFEQAMISAQSATNIEATTGLTSQQLTSFYQGFANSEKVLTIYSQGVNQSTSGSDKVNAIVNCHLATGKIGKVGSGPFSVTGQPNAMGGREVGALANTLAAHMEFDNPNHIESIKRFWQSDNLSTKPGLKAIDMFDALKDGKIKAIWIMATNPVVSLPDSEKIKSALRDCPFVVVSDCIADTETTRFADMVLPAQGWSEKSGTVTNSERRISRQRRLMPSPGLAKPDWWIISQVAKKMGFAQAFDYRHEGEIFREYAQLTTQDNHNGERDLNLIGLTQLDDKGYSQLSPQQWPVTSLQNDIVDQRMFTDGQFFTANKRANFVAVEHHLPKSDTSETYPLLLNTGRSRDHWHTMTRTGLSARLAEHKPEPFMLIHPTIAKRFTIEQGQIAKVMNAQGECQARVEISDEVSSDQVFVAIHWNNLTAKNSKPCDLIAPHTDAFSGQPEFKHTPVTLAACHYQSCAIFLTKQPLDFNECDYWSRQKVAGGYLYRIESALSVYQLTQILKQKFIGNSEKLLTVETGTQHRLATIKQDQLSQLAIVQPSVDGWELDQWIESFTQPFLLEQEQLFLAKQCA